jgi:hypothetical protein
MAGSPRTQHHIEEIISSYEERLQSIGFIIDNTQMILGEFQETIPNVKEDTDSLKDKLRNTLARNESLRKKDFDAMMNTILLAQTTREAEVKGLLNSYLAEQRDMAKTLRKTLESFRGFLYRDNIDRVEEFHQMFQNILKKQEERKAEVTTELKRCQKEQSELSDSLVELLSRGRDLRTKDLRVMLKKFGIRSTERAIQHRERKEDVQAMLNSFKTERYEGARI